MGQFLAFGNGANNVTYLLNQFLINGGATSQTSTTHAALVVALNAAQDNIVNTYSTSSLGGASRATYKFRFLVAADDGTVIADSSKDANNTWDNYKGKIINENHNSRPEIMVAVLSNNGTGYANRFSSSVGAKLQYLAQRLGTSVQENIGTIRLSVSEAL